MAYLDSEFKEFLSKGYPKEQGKWSFTPMHRYGNTASRLFANRIQNKKPVMARIYVAYTFHHYEHEKA